MTISELKKDAKSRLSGKLGKAVGINVIYFIISFILQLIGNKIETDSLKSVYLIIVAIITLPLSYGILASMIKLSRGENVTVILSYKNYCSVKLPGIEEVALSKSRCQNLELIDNEIVKID